MRALIFGSAIAAAVVTALAFAAPDPVRIAPPTAPSTAAQVYEVDGVHSAVLFRVKHVDASWFYGRFNDVKGSFTWDEEKPENSKVSIAIAAASVDTAVADRDKHLQSPDFLSAAEFPEITFVSTSAKKSRLGLSITGDLTLRGVKRTITVEAEHVGKSELPKFGPRAGFTTTFSIQRSEFGSKYGLPDALGDDVTLIVCLEGVKK
jgi:polyisoprenoid-binding protein YceI